ncbi:conserved hypothetical protein (plasmid) [Methanohalobium evestigatum Z-7303]|uniref:RAP domain-containing protein n=2 Tax=Methanohalobium evestigatum TaxID=2322 RepID=D7EC03_METEZ|nr:conserved hypothetical protein [Methanohalobium evestigatum Z-7303]
MKLALNLRFDAMLKTSGFSTFRYYKITGINHGSLAARHLLLEGNLDTLDYILALSKDERYSKLIDALNMLENSNTTTLTELAAYWDKYTENINWFYEQVKGLGISESLNTDELENLHKDLADMISIQNRVNANNSALNVIRKANKGDLIYPGADCIELRDAIEAAKIIHSVDIPANMRQNLFVKDYKSQKDYLSKMAANIYSDLGKVDSASSEAKDIAHIDFEDFFKGDSEKLEIQYLIDTIVRAENNPEELQNWSKFIDTVEKASEAGISPVIDTYLSGDLYFENLDTTYEQVLYRNLAHIAYEKYPELNRFSGLKQEEARERFRKTDRELIDLERKYLRAKLAKAPITRRNSEGLPRDKTELGLINHERSKKRKHISFRDLMNRAGKAIQELKPCFMMSPLSVSQYLKPGTSEFDLVVIDEASQMKPEDSLGALARSKQIVVVGDPKQLPPTSFFERLGGDDNETEENDADTVESILEMAMRCWQPYRRLLWHYRSRHESLIDFSNKKFYNDQLIVFPSPVTNHPSYGVHMEYVGGTCRKGGTNIKEAQRVAEAAVEFMQTNPEQSLGVVAMNKVQTDLIEDEVSRLLTENTAAYNYIEHWDKINGGLESFFVKNLENVQGDERDVIFISTTYGPDSESGKVHQRFGPINSNVGYRRLNVLFTRAKEQVQLFTSMRPSDVRVNEENVNFGRRALHDYLEYAATGRLQGGDGSSNEPENDFERHVKEHLEKRGFDVDCQVGVSGYFIDLAVSHPAFSDGYLAGIECDGATYHSAKSARDRDRLRQEILENLGWDIYRVWSTDWFANPKKETDKLEQYIHSLLETKAPVTLEKAA